MKYIDYIVHSFCWARNAFLLANIFSALLRKQPPLLLVGEILTLPGSQLVRQGAQLRNKYAHCCGHNPSFAVWVSTLVDKYQWISTEYPCILIKFPFHSANIHMVSHNFPVLLLLESEFGLINIIVFWVKSLFCDILIDEYPYFGCWYISFLYSRSPYTEDMWGARWRPAPCGELQANGSRPGSMGVWAIFLVIIWRFTMTYHDFNGLDVYLCFIVFGKPVGHREVAPREFHVHSRWKPAREQKRKEVEEKEEEERQTKTKP